MADQIDASERLLNLVIALVNTRGRMTKEQVRTGVAGYQGAQSDDAFERMFERDKDALRDLGIPVLTVTDAGHGDDVGYRIDVDTYALPPLDLTAAELGVLTMAAQLWQDQALSADTSRALTKLSVVGTGPRDGGLVAGLSPRVRPGGRALAPLVDAVQDRRAVRFTYRAANTGEVRERTVEPWKLLARRGGWVLIGFDRDRGASRSFRLSRIEGTVRAVGPAQAFPPPDPADLDAAMAAWRPGAERVATLALLPERASALRARAVPAPPEAPDPAVDPLTADVVRGRDVVHVAFTDTHALAEEVLGYGDAAIVLAPAAVRAVVLDMLRTAAGLDARLDGEVARTAAGTEDDDA